MTGDAAVAALAGAVRPVDGEAAVAARRALDELAKPPGSLGRVEDLGVQLAAISGRCPPPTPQHPVAVVAAGDHGVHARGVTAWPQAVTAAMVGVIADGRAAVNRIAAIVGARVVVLDVGVAVAVGAAAVEAPSPAVGASAVGAPSPAVRRARVRDGTADLVTGPAMERGQAVAAVRAGAALIDELVDGGADLVAAGDMGIANTTAAACLVGALTGADARAVTGRGAGVDDAALAVKRDAVAAALARHRAHAATCADPLAVLACLGGLEHAALVGVLLAGAARRVPVVLDGVSADAAALVATALCPAAIGYLLAGHRSVEPGAAVALEQLGLLPVLDLSLRLGEATGALLAVPVVRAAAALLGGMARLDELGA